MWLVIESSGDLCEHGNVVRFKVFRVVMTQVVMRWVVILCSDVVCYQCFIFSSL